MARIALNVSSWFDILFNYVGELLADGFANIVVVNDGSSAAYDEIFQSVDALVGCTVLRHPENIGKGAALKTGYEHILKNLPKCLGVITADSDDQHAAADVCKVADKILKNQGFGKNLLSEMLEIKGQRFEY